jgi:hypothetical protein
MTRDNDSGVKYKFRLLLLKLFHHRLKSYDFQTERLSM